MKADEDWNWENLKNDKAYFEWREWLAIEDDKQIAEQQDEIDALKIEMSNLRILRCEEVDALRKEIAHLRALLQSYWTQRR
jgi:hypothetical protein